MNEQSKRNEVRIFFEAASELSNAFRNGDTTEVDYLLDEIDAIRMNTEQPGLRRRCQRVLDQHRSANVRFA